MNTEDKKTNRADELETAVRYAIKDIDIALEADINHVARNWLNAIRLRLERGIEMLEPNKETKE